MANTSYWNYINYQGAWSSTVTYRTQINTPSIGIGLSLVSCPQITYSGALYIANGYDSVSGLPAQPTLGSHPNVDTAWTLVSISGGGGGGVTSVSGGTANGVDVVVADGTTTPAISVTFPETGIQYSNGTALSAAIASNFPTLNQNTSGNAATATALENARTIYGNSFNGTANVSGVITVPFGGIGIGTTTPYAILTGGTTSTGALQQLATLGSAGQVLTSTGAGSLPDWETPSSGGSGLSPYNGTNIYNKGVSYITGDGTNGQIGFIYVCLVNGTTGAFNANDWAVETGLDLVNFNTYSSTFGVAASNAGTYNTYTGYNCGTAPAISSVSTYNNISGAFSFSSSSTITGLKNVIHGGSTATGSVTSASYNSIFGFGAGTGISTAEYNIFAGYAAGSLVDVGNANILLGDLGTTGGGFNNNFVVSNPQNNNNVISISGTDTPILANQVLATPIDATGSLSVRSIIPSYTTTAKNSLSVGAGTTVYDTTLNKLSFFNGTAWEVVTSV